MSVTNDAFVETKQTNVTTTNNTEETKAKEQTREHANAEEQVQQGAQDERVEQAQQEERSKNTVNKFKYERDMQAKDAEIAELKSKIAEAAKSEETAQALREEIAQLESKFHAEKLNSELLAHGCRNVKAASAILDDYDGNIAELIKHEPYLFESKTVRNTTGEPSDKPKGPVSNIREGLEQTLNR